MKQFYLAILDDGMQDFRSACGPFYCADLCAASEPELLAARCIGWSFDAPRQLAVIGDYFICYLSTPNGLNTVIGPRATLSQARACVRELLRGGGVFEAGDPYFIAVVRFIRQDAPELPQIAILESVA